MAEERNLIVTKILGNDPFWTVTGDNVTSLVLTDYRCISNYLLIPIFFGYQSESLKHIHLNKHLTCCSKNGLNELVVGSEDFEIRVTLQLHINSREK